MISVENRDSLKTRRIRFVHRSLMKIEVLEREGNVLSEIDSRKLPLQLATFQNTPS